MGLILVVVAAYDLTQRRHAILRNFPVIGHLRYLLESVGPELRQYIVTDNRRERPFDRDQRRWIYTSAKGINNNFGFGSDEDLDAAPGHIIIDQSMFPLRRPDPDEDTVPCTKVLGSARQRPGMFRPASVVNVSAMSFGALSGVAVEAINRGCALAGCLHNTGEGGLTPHHLHGGELVFQIGTGYFGCRDRNGRFDLHRLADLCAEHPVRAIEIKLSQGAKPGLAGCSQPRKSRQRSPRQEGWRRGETAAVRPGTARSQTSTACSTSSRPLPNAPACPSASNRP